MPEDVNLILRGGVIIRKTCDHNDDDYGKRDNGGAYRVLPDNQIQSTVLNDRVV